MPPPLTKTQWMQTLEALRQEPTRGAAAALLGINTSALRQRVAIAKANGWELPPPSAAPQDATRVSNSDQVTNLQRENEQLKKALDEARQARLPKLPKPSRPPRTRKSKLVVGVPDVHGSKAHKASLAALYADLKTLKPDKIILGGDQMDCGGFLAQHHTMGFVAETEYTVEEDALATNAHLDMVQSLCDDVHYIEGNHEHRLEMWCVNQSLRNTRDSSFLLDRFGPESLFRIKQRGIKYYSRREFYDDLHIRGTMRLGNTLVTHGSCTGVNAARSHLMKWQCNLWYFHTHRPDMASIRTPLGGMLYSMTPGCLSEYSPFWNHDAPTGWGHGYTIGELFSDGRMFSAIVPIEGGESMLPSTLIGG